MTRLEPVATYRVQLTPTNRFDDVGRRVDELHDLGISHLYLSPVTEAVPGSTHGYDVIDHTLVRRELGGMAGLLELFDRLHERDMAAIVDHVPNHTAVGRPELNPRWWQLLREGPSSPAADWFDVDWAAGGGRVVLPVLGEPLEELVAAHALRVEEGPYGRRELRIGEQRFPLAVGTGDGPIEEVLAAQHYVLQWWRDPRRNVRRFFTIDDLVAVRVEDPTVAHAVDTVPRLLRVHPAFAGVRVDHVDGLADPGTYLANLRELIGERWLLVEKILAPGETLPSGWPVDGTTGYEHARVLEHALVDRAGFDRLRTRWEAFTGDGRAYEEWDGEARREVLAGGLRPDVERVARRAVDAGVDASPAETAEAVTLLSAHLGRYRTYFPLDSAGAEDLQHAYATAAEAAPDLRPVLDQLVVAIAAPGPLRTSWQQLTGPATAKGVEDRVFYRYLPLSTLNEVGGEPVPTTGEPVGDLHEWHRRTQDSWPRSLLAGTTHDTKRSEDVRARGLALAAAAERWAALLEQWPGAGTVDPAMQWLALQTLVVTAPISRDRLEAFLVKAAREAAVHTAWTDPDETYEGALGKLADAVATWEPAVQLAAELDRAGRDRSVAMLAVRLTAPGVADVYQGTECFRFVLVDPDNRAQPDPAELQGVLARAADVDGPTAWGNPDAESARAVVLRRCLGARRAAGSLLGYQPVPVVGPDAADVIAFVRLDADGAPVLATVVARRAVTPAAMPTGAPVAPIDATAALPGAWRSVLDDGAGIVEDSLDVGAALARFPACVLRPAGAVTR